MKLCRSAPCDPRSGGGPTLGRDGNGGSHCAGAVDRVELAGASEPTAPVASSCPKPAARSWTSDTGPTVRLLPDNVPHRHAYFEVCRVGERGRGQYLVNGVPHAIGPGDLFFSRPGVLHQIVNTEQPMMELFWMTFYLQLAGRRTG